MRLERTKAEFDSVSEGRTDPQNRSRSDWGINRFLGWRRSVVTKKEPEECETEVNCRYCRIQVSDWGWAPVWDWGWAPVWDRLSGSGRVARLDLRSLCRSPAGRKR